MGTMTRAIDEFRAYLRRRSYSEHTLESYTLDLQLFFAALDNPLEPITFREVDRFIDTQHQQGLAPTTINRRLHALKHVFDFLIERRAVGTNPIKPSHMLRRGRSLPKGLTKD
jgi:integrase/recombinase XerC